MSIVRRLIRMLGNPFFCTSSYTGLCSGTARRHFSGVFSRIFIKARPVLLGRLGLGALIPLQSRQKPWGMTGFPS